MPTLRTTRRLLAVTVVLILLATLRPSQPKDTRAWLFCVVCEEQGVADALLNTLLFAPLGALLSLGGWRARRTVAAAALFSATIECLQYVAISGRYASIGDVIFNVVGAAAGVALVKTQALWLGPTARWAGRLRLAATACGALVLLATGWLLEPSLPGGPYKVAATAQVIRIAGLDAGRPDVELQVNLPLPQPPRGRTTLLEIADSRNREVLLVGAARGGLVVRYRTRSDKLRFDKPDLRVPGTVADTGPEAALRVAVKRGAHGYCVALSEVTTCQPGITLGRGWAILNYPEDSASWLKSCVDIGWLLALAVPLGFWAERRTHLAAGGAMMLAAMLVAPAFTAVRPTPAEQFAAAAAGVMLGRWLGVRISRRQRVSTT